MSTTLLAGAAEVWTGESVDPATVRRGAAVALRDGQIVGVGPEPELAARLPGARRLDCRDGVITPGFVDSHTHAVFGRWRADEYALRCAGVPYMEIARRGGGINASVQDVRSRSEDELVELSLPRLATMLRHGTTTAEVKSGYGLSTADELKMLRAAKRLAESQPITLVPTFLGAHEFPPEFAGRHDAYVDLLAEEMIPAVVEEGLARFCDVFVEPGVFTVEQARRVLESGRRHGLTPKLHADELENAGGAELAVEVEAASADHLGAVSPSGIAALAGSETVATLLPGTLFFLGRQRYAPARQLLAAGAKVALASDFNPGSSTNPNMQLVLTIACSHMGMNPMEALHAATAGGARALQLGDGTGTLRPGAPADLLVWDVAAIAEIGYRYGTNLVAAVFKAGELVAGRL